MQIHHVLVEIEKNEENKTITDCLDGIKIIKISKNL